MVAAGQPRFNEYFNDVVHKIKGADEVDIYFYFWNNYNWSNEYLTEGWLNLTYIKSLLPNNFNLKKVCQVKEPEYSVLVKPEIETIPKPPYRDNNFLDKVYKQFYSIYKAYKMIDEEYDCIIKFRVDSSPDREFNLNEYDLSEGIYIPDNTRYSEADIYEKITDQFAIGNHKNMHTYFSLYENMDSYFINRNCPIHQETALSCHLTNNFIPMKSSNFKHYIKDRPLIHQQ